MSIGWGPSADIQQGLSDILTHTKQTYIKQNLLAFELGCLYYTFIILI